jgi:hypothetical protein
MKLGEALGAVLLNVSVGAVRAAENKHYTKPEVRRAFSRKARERAEKCTPCAAAAYVDGLRKQYGG